MDSSWWPYDHCNTLDTKILQLVEEYLVGLGAKGDGFFLGWSDTAALLVGSRETICRLHCFAIGRRRLYDEALGCCDP